MSMSLRMGILDTTSLIQPVLKGTTTLLFYLGGAWKPGRCQSRAGMGQTPPADKWRQKEKRKGNNCAHQEGHSLRDQLRQLQPCNHKGNKLRL
eukprot:1158705-Pelagomonas_calceolata.AAC.5